MKTNSLNRTEFIRDLYASGQSEQAFSRLALRLFSYQASHNPIYKKFLQIIQRPPSTVRDYREIPFLPIQLFKTNDIKTGTWDPSLMFTSSRTGGSLPSKAYVRDSVFYERNARFCFESIFGSLNQFRWYALLPSYLEQGNSSLVFMVKSFMDSHPGARGGFFMNDYAQLLDKMASDHSGLKIILIGVSYALLDLALEFRPDFSRILVMETGGMKGRGKEIPREELYAVLRENMQVQRIHSEYGMTELLSQAYSPGDGLFQLPSTMRVLISDLNDPYNLLPTGQQGRINIVDLANLDTCAFIATDDLGVLDDSGQLRILGRTDSSDIRGCNLLYTR